MAATITPLALASRLDDESATPFILDVRAPEQFERWRISGRVEPATHNIPYWTALTDLPAIRQVTPDDQDVVVVCAHGGSSGMVVEMLEAPNVVNLEGGMKAWAATLVPHTLLDEGGMFVIQFDRIAKACLSYAVGTRGETMAVIDPAVAPEIYLDQAAAQGATITHVFDTHLHADHVSVGAELAERAGATYLIAPGDAEGATFLHTPLEDGAVFRFGELELVVRSVATPGHTPGSTSLEVAGRFLMTGDAVFVSGVGRPDLGGATDPWARDLFHTIHDRLAELDPALLVCPAHYTDRTEADQAGQISRRLGDLLTNDPVVSIDDEQAFVEYVKAHLGNAPGVYDDIRKVNLGILDADPDRIEELEVGRNECALSG